MIGDIFDIYGNVINKNPSQEFLYNTQCAEDFSAFTVIDGVLYAFSGGTYNENVPTTGRKYKINSDGSLTDLNDTFTCNFGHQNTVDFNHSNRYLLSTNGGNSISVQPNKIYLMGPYGVGSSPSSFLVNDGLTIDISSENWGKQPNAVWGESNVGMNDIIYVLTNYEEGNMDSYDQGNPGGFTGESKRYIHKLQLGKGTSNLGKGIIRTAKSNEFNGTYKVLNTYEYPFAYNEGINDCCFWRGKIYYNGIANGMSMVEIGFDNYNNDLAIRRLKIDHFSGSGEEQLHESEGLTIHNDIMYIGNPVPYIKTYYAENIL